MVPDKATTLRGVLILTSTFAQGEAWILQRVIRGQVLKERTIEAELATRPWRIGAARNQVHDVEQLQ